MGLSGAIAAVVAMTLMTLGLVVYEAIMGKSKGMGVVVAEGKPAMLDDGWMDDDMT